MPANSQTRRCLLVSKAWPDRCRRRDGHVRLLRSEAPNEPSLALED